MPVNGQLDLFAEFAPNGTEVSKNASFETLETTPHNYKLVDNEEDMIIDFDIALLF